MIVDERMRTYINSLDMGNTPFLEELEQYAIRERVPIIRREMQSFIKMFLAVNRPKRILEVGTAIGFSTLLMCEYGPEDLEIVTIENYEKRIPMSNESSSSFNICPASPSSRVICASRPALLKFSFAMGILFS